MPDRMPMRSTALLVAALLFAALSAPVAGQDSFRLPGLAGGELSRADLEQGAVVVVVWAAWSPRCREIPEQVATLARDWGGRARVVTVNFQEERGEVEAFLRGRSMAAPVFLDADGQFGRAYGVTNLPALLILRDGRPLYNGRWPSDVDALLAEHLR
jgi:thioredoxin-like negative regulator of GroEL